MVEVAPGDNHEIDVIFPVPPDEPGQTASSDLARQVLGRLHAFDNVVQRACA